MADDRVKRIDDALASLVDSLLPPSSSDEDDNAFDDRHGRALELARSILDRPLQPRSVSDVNGASDLIKKKLLRENSSPEKAVRFSNLYQRLLTQPVLSQKWAILYMLYQLSDHGDVAGPGPSGRRSPLLETNQLENILLRERLARRAGGLGDGLENGGDEIGFNDSVSRKGSAAGALPTRERERERKVRPAVEELKSTLAEASGPQLTVNGGIPIPKDTSMQPPESALLRDLPFNLQGLSSANFEFTNAATIRLPPTLPIPIISVLHTLAEPCLLYRSLSEYTQGSGGGLVGQSLRAAIGNELRSYLGLVATLEGEIRRALASGGDGIIKNGMAKAGVTLKRCVIWTRDATMGLRLMSLMVEQSKDRRGGQIISMIHGFSTSHGDPFVGAFAERLLSHVTRPFYDMLRQWIYDGELSDPYDEFFVIEPEPQPTDTRAAATSVWEDKYKQDEDMIPSIITAEFAKKIFLIGKSLNFIRYSCGDSGWVEAYSKEASKELRYGDTATLETSIDEAHKTTMARLIHLMDAKFKLFDHLRALKKYLLLGQGDFIALLMESLASNLDRPANSQYRHTLTAQLEHAIRASNAQFDPPDVLRRLDARMLELSHGEIGWDCFTLEYKVDAPVDVVITPWGSTQYLKVFNFLWRIKRVEFALGSTWRRCMTGARGVLSVVSDKVGADWKRTRCVIAEMIHFVNQLQYYILFEVIEASWDQLQHGISKPGCTLDDLIEAHTTYLNSITHKGLLGFARASASGRMDDSFLVQLHQILKIMLSYKDVVDGLYSFSVAEFTKRQELSAKIETRTAQGKWGLSERDSDDSPSLNPNPRPLLASNSSGTNSPFLPPLTAGNLAYNTDDALLPSLRSRLASLSKDFRARVNVFLGDLAYQPDVDMRFLGVVMNFNDVYRPVRKGKSRTQGRKGEVKREDGSAAAGPGSESERPGASGETQNQTPAESVADGRAKGKGKGKERA